MPFFEHDGIRLHYRDEGAGLPFFFQHGLGADVSQPFGLVALPRGFRMIAFDARGHGESAVPADDGQYSFNVFANDLLAVMLHLGIERAVVGGISMGAAIALNFALRHRERVAGLVLSRPAWLDAPNPWNVQMFSLISALLAAHGAARGREQFMETSEFREAKRDFPDVAESLAAQFDRPGVERSAEKFERIIRDAPCHDRRGWVQLGVPTLVLASRRDPVHPFSYAEDLARTIAGAEFRELTPKAVSVEQHNAEVQRHVVDFLRRNFDGVAG